MLPIAAASTASKQSAPTSGSQRRQSKHPCVASRLAHATLRLLTTTAHVVRSRTFGVMARRWQQFFPAPITSYHHRVTIDFFLYSDGIVINLQFCSMRSTIAHAMQRRQSYFLYVCYCNGCPPRRPCRGLVQVSMVMITEGFWMLS